MLGNLKQSQSLDEYYSWFIIYTQLQYQHTRSNHKINSRNTDIMYISPLLWIENRFYRLNTSAEFIFIHTFEGYISRAILACCFVVDVSSFLYQPKAISSFYLEIYLPFVPSSFE